MNDTSEVFDVENHFRNEINRYCHLPEIGQQDAFDLWRAATDLVGGVDTLCRLVPKYGSQEVIKLVKRLAKRVLNHPTTGELHACEPSTADIATETVRTIGRRCKTVRLVTGTTVSRPDRTSARELPVLESATNRRGGSNA
jgi:hypothetical protein